MAITTYLSPRYSERSSTSEYHPEPKKSLWKAENMIDNLPPWIYSSHEEPKSVQECRARISSLEFTIRDIDLQFEIRELELRTGNSRHNSAFDFEKWRIGALRAKQTHFYVLNALTYWLILNTAEEADLKKKFTRLTQLLIEDPKDFVQQAEALLD
jgi:hypothetical protein